MGWNSWNWHGKKEINEQLIKETIDAIVEKGLKNAGYEYVVIDGGWRDEKLGPNGELLPHPVKFPNGIRPLVEYAHSRGLKLGLHTVPGTHDCGRDRVGGFGNEQVHIRLFRPCLIFTIPPTRTGPCINLFVNTTIISITSSSRIWTVP